MAQVDYRFSACGASYRVSACETRNLLSKGRSDGAIFSFGVFIPQAAHGSAALACGYSRSRCSRFGYPRGWCGVIGREIADFRRMQNNAFLQICGCQSVRAQVGNLLSWACGARNLLSKGCGVIRYYFFVG